MVAWRERIQLRLPCSVLISPLCAMKRNGCARSQVGKVLVEKRWWARASAEMKRLSCRSVKNSPTWWASSMPL